MIMGILPEVPEWVGWTMFAVSTLLAINAGKGLAAKKHDAGLAKRYGRHLSMFGLALYFYAILSIIFSLISTLATKALSMSLKLFVGGVNAASVFMGVIYPLLVMGISYVIFRAKYSGVNTPITREGKLVMRIAEKEIELRKKAEKVMSFSSPLQIMDRASKGAGKMVRLFINDEEDE